MGRVGPGRIFCKGFHYIDVLDTVGIKVMTCLGAIYTVVDYVMVIRDGSSFLLIHPPTLHCSTAPPGMSISLVAIIPYIRYIRLHYSSDGSDSSTSLLNNKV